jgi:hypothetical protein
MKPFLVLLALILAGCAHEPTAREMIAADDAYCINLGYDPDTDGYRHCRMQRTQLRLQLLDRDAIRHCQTFGDSMVCF